MHTTADRRPPPAPGDAATAAHQAAELRALLRAGVLPRLGLVDVGMGSRLAFELAVNVTLADLGRLAAQAGAGRAVDARRRCLLIEDLGRLHRMTASSRGLDGRGPACALPHHPAERRSKHGRGGLGGAYGC